MRIAIAQVRVDHPSRSAAIQEIMSAVDRAADTDPAPDLVVLPGGCDADGRASAAARESVVEAIAHRAREWGVYVAAGVHGGGRCEGGPCALLFDADGDVAACATPSNGGAPDGDAPGVAICETPCGAIGIVDATSIAYARACEVAAGRDVLMAVPIPGRVAKRTAAVRRDIASFLAPVPVGSRAHWAVVLPARRSSAAPRQSTPGEVSVVWAPDGSPMASANRSDEVIVFVDVPIAPIAPR